MNGSGLEEQTTQGPVRFYYIFHLERFLKKLGPVVHNFVIKWQKNGKVAHHVKATTQFYKGMKSLNRGQLTNERQTKTIHSLREKWTTKRSFREKMGTDISLHLKLCTETFTNFPCDMSPLPKIKLVLLVEMWQKWTAGLLLRLIKLAVRRLMIIYVPKQTKHSLLLVSTTLIEFWFKYPHPPSVTEHLQGPTQAFIEYPAVFRIPPYINHFILSCSYPWHTSSPQSHLFYFINEILR